MPCPTGSPPCSWASRCSLVAGVMALVGKKEVQQATPPAPEHAIEGVKEDIAVVKGEHR